MIHYSCGYLVDPHSQKVTAFIMHVHVGTSAATDLPATKSTVPTTSGADLPTSIAYKTTDPVTGMSTQGTSRSPTAGQSEIHTALVSSILGPTVGGAIGGLTVVIVIIVVVVIALAFIKRGQKGSLKVNDRKESVQGYNNAVYDGKQNTQTDE